MKKRSKIFFVFVFVVLLGMTFLKYYNNYLEILNLEKEINVVNKEVESARQKNINLKEQLKNVNELEYIEKIARKKLGLVKPGETLIIPVEPEE